MCVCLPQANLYDYNQKQRVLRLWGKRVTQVSFAAGQDFRACLGYSRSCLPCIALIKFLYQWIDAMRWAGYREDAPRFSVEKLALRDKWHDDTILDSDRNSVHL